LYSVGVLEDITERKLADQTLREADRRKDEFLAMLAHELRNPLAPIRTAAGLLRGREVADPLVARSHEIIDRQTTHLARLLDDLLDVSRLSRGTLTLQCREVRLAQVLDDAIQTVLPLLDARGQELQIEQTDQPIVLDGDPDRLTQVFSNLLNNAANYSGPGAAIELRVHVDGETASVSVRDTGIGIAPHMLDRIFDLFTQGGAAGDRVPGGLGIGLSLARRLVEMHGGTIAAQSEGLGHGAAFTVRLPGARPGAPARAIPREQPMQMELIKRRVLVADDNVDAADTVAMLLTASGCDVRTVYGGAAAVEEAERFRPDLVFLDIGMPDVNGNEACLRIRSQPWGSTMALVAVTGWGQEDDRQRSALVGFDEHLVKPVDPDSLIQLACQVWPSRHGPSRTS